MNTSGKENERQKLLERAIQRFSPARLTFAETEFFNELWQAGYEVTPQDEPRLVFVSEGDKTYPAQWRLNTQALANNRLFALLTTGAWDGRQREQELARLDAEDGVQYIFCPVDPRFHQGADGALELAVQAKPFALPDTTRAALDQLAPALLEHWQRAGAPPWTVGTIQKTLGILGWAEATDHQSWRAVQAWLQDWAAAARVGQDHWVLADHIPPGPTRIRLQVLPIRPAASNEPGNENASLKREEAAAGAISPEPTASQDGEILLSPEEQQAGALTRWVMTLRTAHLTGGFVPVPASARSAYPAISQKSSFVEVMPARWYDANEAGWVWLDRSQDILFGPDLASQLAWLEAGQRLRITWTTETVAFRLDRVDTAVQQEERRLVDSEALAALRGGLGESYRRSLLAILQEHPAGLTFREVVQALEQRQQHPIHRGTVRALLAAGGFLHHTGRWFAAPDAQEGARQLRAALLDALTSTQSAVNALPPQRPSERLRLQASTITSRLRELMKNAQ